MAQSPLKLMFIAARRGAGGSEKFLLGLIEGLSGRDNIDMLTVVAEGSWLHQQMRRQNLPHKTEEFGGIFDFRTKKNLRALAKEFQPHVIHSWMTRAAKYAPKDIGVSVARLGGYYHKRPYKGTQHMVCATPDMCQFIEKTGWPKERVHYIPDFVNFPRHDFKDYRLDVRAEYGIHTDAKVILMIGRFHESKGFDTALFALNHLSENVHCLLVGTGPEEKALKAAVEADGLTERVHFAGWVEHMAPLFAAADMLLIPSRQPSFGGAVLEGWAHQKPVIVADTVGPRALIEHEKTGLIIPKDNDEAIAQAVERLIKDEELASTIAQNGAQQARTHYTEEKVIDAYVNLYNELKR